MRVSDTQMVRSMVSNMGRLNARLLDASQKASTGLKYAGPSDDPVVAARLARVQASVTSTEAYQATTASVASDLSVAESALDTAGSVMHRVREVALQGANDSLDASNRVALADEVRHLREQLLSAANQKGSNGYLFGGTATTQPPFDTAGVFVGNNLSQVVEIGPKDVMESNVSGAEAFTAAGGRDVFADLAALETALRADNGAAVRATVNDLDTCQRQILAARVDAGLRLERLSTADEVHERSLLALQTQRSDMVDADPTEVYSSFVSAQQSVEQAVAASRLLLQTLGKNRFG